jgi:hypothetical protein
LARQIPVAPAIVFMGWIIPEREQSFALFQNSAHPQLTAQPFFFGGSVRSDRLLFQKNDFGKMQQDIK